MIGSSRSYAIGMAHYQMGGGWKSVVAVCGVYLLMVLAGVGLFYYADMSSPVRHGMTSAAVTLLVIVQAIALVVFGAFRVSGAIRGDVSSQMIESHRLMPVSSWRAVTGYMLGASAQTIAFGMLSLVMIYVFAGVTGTDLGKVTIGQATLFAFAFLVWSACAVGTFVARYLVFVGLVVLMPGLCVMYWVYVALPGLALLTSPFIGESIFQFTTGVSAEGWIHGASLVMQGWFFLLFFVGACRRYRGTYLTTFSLWQAFLLLLGWCVATAWAMGLGNEVRISAGPGRGYEADLHSPQVIASVIAGMLIAIVPVRTLVIEQKGKQRRSVLTVGFLVVVAAAIALMPVGWLVRRGVETSQPLVEMFAQFTAFLIETGLAVGAYVVALYALLYLTRNLRPWVIGLIVGPAVLVMWCLPLVLEVMRLIYLENHRNYADGSAGPEFGLIGNFSPVGMLINVWGNEAKVSPVAGIVWQWVVAMGLGVWAGLRKEKLATEGKMAITNDEIRMTKQI